MKMEKKKLKKSKKKKQKEGGKEKVKVLQSPTEKPSSFLEVWQNDEGAVELGPGETSHKLFPLSTSVWIGIAFTHEVSS